MLKSCLITELFLSFLVFWMLLTVALPLSLNKNWVVVSNIFWIFTLGEMIQFDLRIFFKWVAKNHQLDDHIWILMWWMTNTETSPIISKNSANSHVLFLPAPSWDQNTKFSGFAENCPRWETPGWQTVEGSAGKWCLYARKVEARCCYAAMYHRNIHNNIIEPSLYNFNYLSLVL